MKVFITICSLVLLSHLGANVILKAQSTSDIKGSVRLQTPLNVKKDGLSLKKEGNSLRAIPEDSNTDTPKIKDVISGIGKTINDWKALGWVAGLIALINLLIMVLKLPLLNNVFVRYNIKWVKPYIAVVLGALFVGFSSFATGAGVLNSIVAGIMAALGSVGLHEILARRKTPEEGKEAK